MSITRELCKSVTEPNANPSHLHSEPWRLILLPVKTNELHAGAAFPLADLAMNRPALVASLSEVPGLDDGNGSGATLLARLRDLGFVSGARCEVIARMWLGGDPLVVRIGGSTFALRREEAVAVRVTSAA